MSNPSTDISDSWPKDDDGDNFGYPPLEIARQLTRKPWRGVSFGEVRSELYYEPDRIPGIYCNTDDISLNDTAMSTPDLDQTEVKWDNMMKGLCQDFYTIVDDDTAPGENETQSQSPVVNKKYEVLKYGLTTSVPIDNVTKYENFQQVDNSDHVELIEDGTLTIAVSYVHHPTVSSGLLKADEKQISQLRSILTAIKKKPPEGTKRVRLWTDQALTASLEGKNVRPDWILYGLLPYAFFATAVLRSDEETDMLRTWIACERILADGGNGCLFNRKYLLPAFCTQEIAHEEAECEKTIGLGLSLKANLRRLCSLVHAGVLDHTVTYHIDDAQKLINLAYYVLRKDKQKPLQLEHALGCARCLSHTKRENSGFLDVLHESVDSSAGKRHNRGQRRWPYPKVRARRGYKRWHGMREFLPGAGQLAKNIPEDEYREFKNSCKVIKLLKREEIPGKVKKRKFVDCEDKCIIIYQDHSKSQHETESQVGYIALMVCGRDLFSKHAVVYSSNRLNIENPKEVHSIMRCRGMPTQMKRSAISFFGPGFVERKNSRTSTNHDLNHAMLQKLKLFSLVALSDVCWSES